MYQFSPTLSSLQQLHKELFGDTEIAFAAGMLRTLPLIGGKTEFAPAYKVPELMKEIFIKHRSHPDDIIEWIVYVIGYIHPFLDGNRRTCWQFANFWLSHLGYPPINWEQLRPYWESDIQKNFSLDERIKNIIKLLSR